MSEAMMSGAVTSRSKVRRARTRWWLACALAQTLALLAGAARAVTPPAPAVTKSPSPGAETPLHAKEDASKTPEPTVAGGKPDTRKKDDAAAAASGDAHARKKEEITQRVGGGASAEPARVEKASSPDKGVSGAKADSPEKAEPAGPVGPPIKMAALRDEMSRPHREERSPARAEREKLEQLAGEINKAREGLRQDTARLESLVAARDTPPLPPSGGDGGEPVKLVPTPLDTLAKAMRGMKPEQAAPIISRVGRKLGADVLLRMPATDAGKVLGACKPDVAAELAAEIASRPPHRELKR